jgi:hypothetical protein
MGYESQSNTVWWEDPRTGLLFANEAQAIALGYGKPVSTANTIVQVGSQGSYTQDGRLVGVADLVAPDANNSGYVGAAAANLLNTPSSSADFARDWASSYIDYIGSTGVVVGSAVTKDYPSSPQMVEVWKSIPALTPSAQVQYNTPAGGPGSASEPPTTHMIGAGNTVGTQETVGIADKAKAAVSGYGLYVVGAVVVAVLLLFVAKGGIKSGVTS